MFASATAGEFSAGVSKSRLAGMGLGGMRPISDAAGSRIRGNRAILGGFSAVGIPLDSVGRARLVAVLNWSYYPRSVDLPTVIWRHLSETDENPELLPPAAREF